MVELPLQRDEKVENESKFSSVFQRDFIRRLTDKAKRGIQEDKARLERETQTERSRIEAKLRTKRERVRG